MNPIPTTHKFFHHLGSACSFSDLLEETPTMIGKYQKPKSKLVLALVPDPTEQCTRDFGTVTTFSIHLVH